MSDHSPVEVKTIEAGLRHLDDLARARKALAHSTRGEERVNLLAQH